MISLCSAACVEHLLTALHTWHGLHILTPVAYFTGKHLRMKRTGKKEIKIRKKCFDTEKHKRLGAKTWEWWFWYLVLFHILFLHRLEVGSEVHWTFVFGAQEGSHHLVCWHPHFSQGRLFELAPKVLYLQLQLMDLKHYDAKCMKKTETGRKSSLCLLIL